jgi:hypothetical protein
MLLANPKANRAKQLWVRIGYASASGDLTAVSLTGENAPSQSTVSPSRIASIDCLGESFCPILARILFRMPGCLKHTGHHRDMPNGKGESWTKLLLY